MRQRISRRDIMRFGAAALAGGGIVRHLTLPKAALAGTPYVTGYKALVCVQLIGGNNAFNTIVPTSNGAYSTYQKSRTNLAIAQNTLLALNGQASDGNTYGMHPSCPELQTLFNAGNLAIVCNVGTLVQPTTATQAQGGSVPLPPQLFSHIDQTNQWATSNPQSLDLFGWAGRIGDVLAANGVTANLAYNINVGGQNYWQEGKTTLPYFLGTGGAPLLSVLGKGFSGGTRSTAVQAIQAQARMDANPFVQQYQAIIDNAGAKSSVVTSALKAAGTLTTMFPTAPNDGGVTGDSYLDAQLQQVALMIKAQSQVGDARQIFYVQALGYDTHNNELAMQSQLLKYLSSYVNNFWSALGEINQRNNVTLFTQSEFGRTLGSNGDGSDHGWGGHQMVLGGAVKGGYYGTMPSLAVGSSDDFGLGRIVPTTATDQFAATLASWFGIAAGDLPTLFPNLSKFSSSNLGFMG